MNEDAIKSTTVRQMSSRRSKPSIDALVDGPRILSNRRSKPSMDLLVDNQRVSSPFNIEKKEPISKNTKKETNENRPTDVSDSLKVKLRRESLRCHDMIEPNYNPSSKILNKNIVAPSKMVNNKRKLFSKALNNKRINNSFVDKSNNEVKIANAQEVANDILSNLPYVTLKLNKIDFPNAVITQDDSNESENDDIPLSKVFPDFKVKELSVNCEDIVLSERKKDKSKAKKKSEITNGTKSLTLKNDLRTNISSSGKTSNVATVVTNGAKSPQLRKDSPSKPKKTSLGFGDQISKVSSVKSVKKTRAHKPLHVPNGALKQESTDVAVVDGAAKIEAVIEAPPPMVERPPKCLHEICTNVAVDDFRWDKEFCSADCALVYTKSMFGSWVLHRKAARLQVTV